MRTDRYEIIIYWSNEDNAYIASVPELPGCCAHGKNYADALKNAQQAMTLWIESAEADGIMVPEPKGHRLEYA